MYDFEPPKLTIPSMMEIEIGFANCRFFGAGLIFAQI
jgi:hypothetical protein